ncbi:MAG: LamG domain-containing protein [Planctomycetes bacterium]|nr:LamG domain-containing protein [Planctomycetota bacterium]
MRSQGPLFSFLCCWMASAASIAWAQADPEPHPRALDLVGLHAYAPKVVAAGETIEFRTSSSAPYELSICRLGHAVDDPAGDTVLAVLPPTQPIAQPIHPGSFVHIARNLPPDQRLGALTVECWVRPWKLTGWQTLAGQYNYPNACGFGLFLGPDGRAEFYLGDGAAYRADNVLRGPPLTHRRWSHIVGTWDGSTKAIWVDGKKIAESPFAGEVKPGPAPIWLGACGHDGPAVNILDGDLAMPAIHNRALRPEEIEARFRDQGLTPATGDSVLACWPLSEERGERIVDASPHERHGRIVNSAIWMIGGPSFDGAKVPRFGDYDPSRDARRGHGLRFASDDLYDCGWRVTESFEIPRDAKPGIYVGRYRYELDGVPRMYHVTFVVRKPRGAPRAPILVLAATGTWGAYSATSFVATPPGLHQNWGTGGIENSPGNPPAYCVYRDHQAGQPAYQIGINKPWPNAAPYVLYSPESVGYSHLMRAERFLHVWLEKSAYDYDIIGDYELHCDASELDGYPVLIINGHSEYWSIDAYEAVDRYLRKGGNVAVLSGNSIFWRVSYDEGGRIMECRKLNELPGGRPGCTVGEMWHSQDRRRGSMLRECGYPAWRLVGLETLGFWDAGANSAFETAMPGHFLFQKPEPTGLGKGDAFGGAPGGGFPKAVGHEPDVRLELLRRLTKEIPDGATLPEEPAGIITLADGRQPGAVAFDYFFRPARIADVDNVACQMIYWERPAGGRVFHTGSLGAGWGLSADVRFQTLMRNVLHHFGVDPRR